MRVFEGSLKILFGILGLSFCVACSSGEEKGQESEMPVYGSADSWRSPTLHGQLVFDESNEALFADDALYHAWDFELDSDATLSLEVVSAPDDFDTVMYLYQRKSADDGWGSYIERNDDHLGVLRSRVVSSLSTGLYRVMVKGYESSLRGAFAVSAECAGDGCRSQGPQECVFGYDMAELTQRTTFHRDNWSVVDLAASAALSDVSKQQIILGASQMEGRSMSLEEAITYNDDSEILMQQFSATLGRDYTAYAYYLGDTQVGFIFADGETIQTAIEDSDFYDCRPMDEQGDCLFGQMLYGLREDPDFEFSNEVVLEESDLAQLSTLRLQQLMLGLENHEGQALEFPEYWTWLDEGKIWMHDVTAADGRQFVLFYFYQGDNAFGFLFMEAEQVQAAIGDGEIGDCVALIDAP